MSLRSLLSFLCCILTLTTTLQSQDLLNLSLDEVVALAQSEAPNALIAETRMNNRYWRYQSFLADYRPQIDLEADLPNLNRSIDRITIPDGTDIFIQRALMSNSLGLRLQQGITATGGQIFASTRLERIDIFKTDLASASSSYLSLPISINLFQSFW